MAEYRVEYELRGRRYAFPDVALAQVIELLADAENDRIRRLTVTQTDEP